MAYSTQTDIENAIGPQALIDYTDDDGDGALDAARLTAAIASADATIDAYLRDRYTVPIAAPVPALVREISVDLTIVALGKRRYPNEMPQAMVERRANAMQLLDRLATGRASLPGVTVSADAPPATIRTSERTRLFGEDTLAEY